MPPRKTCIPPGPPRAPPRAATNADQRKARHEKKFQGRRGVGNKMVDVNALLIRQKPVKQE